MPLDLHGWNFRQAQCRNRGGFDQALAAVWDGSVITVTKFDWFARNMAEANEILTDLSGRGASFSASAHPPTTGPTRSAGCSSRPSLWSQSSRPTSGTCAPRHRPSGATRGWP
ncbi:recombinase family protein [Nonomuraea sp. NPDC049784]|uniref:recombinase family protein n=1 Tax=Nonomuraea sp. NPDC049784 TaxID=3154361 RepID=UPI0033D0E1DC